jgi:hypothetical protein
VSKQVVALHLINPDDKDTAAFQMPLIAREQFHDCKIFAVRQHHKLNITNKQLN